MTGQSFDEACAELRAAVASLGRECWKHRLEFGLLVGTIWLGIVLLLWLGIAS